MDSATQYAQRLGFAMGHFVFCRDNYGQFSKPIGERLVDHEFVHADQFERFGDEYMTMYLEEAAGNGRACDSKYEREA